MKDCYFILKLLIFPLSLLVWLGKTEGSAASQPHQLKDKIPDVCRTTYHLINSDLSLRYQDRIRKRFITYSEDNDAIQGSLVGYPPALFEVMYWVMINSDWMKSGINSVVPIPAFNKSININYNNYVRYPIREKVLYASYNLDKVEGSTEISVNEQIMLMYSEIVRKIADCKIVDTFFKYNNSVNELTESYKCLFDFIDKNFVKADKVPDNKTTNTKPVLFGQYAPFIKSNQYKMSLSCEKAHKFGYFAYIFCNKTRIHMMIKNELTGSEFEANNAFNSLEHLGRYVSMIQSGILKLEVNAPSGTKRQKYSIGHTEMFPDGYQNQPYLKESPDIDEFLYMDIYSFSGASWGDGGSSNGIFDQLDQYTKAEVNSNGYHTAGNRSYYAGRTSYPLSAEFCFDLAWKGALFYLTESNMDLDNKITIKSDKAYYPRSYFSKLDAKSHIELNYYGVLLDIASKMERELIWWIANRSILVGSKERGSDGRSKKVYRVFFYKGVTGEDGTEKCADPLVENYYFSRDTAEFDPSIVTGKKEQDSQMKHSLLYHTLRATAESNWFLSSRWVTDKTLDDYRNYLKNNPSSTNRDVLFLARNMCTHKILPIDLNSVMADHIRLVFLIGVLSRSLSRERLTEYMDLYYGLRRYIFKETFNGQYYTDLYIGDCEKVTMDDTEYYDLQKAEFGRWSAASLYPYMLGIYKKAMSILDYQQDTDVDDKSSNLTCTERIKGLLNPAIFHQGIEVIWPGINEDLKQRISGLGDSDMGPLMPTYIATGLNYDAPYIHPLTIKVYIHTALELASSLLTATVASQDFCTILHGSSLEEKEIKAQVTYIYSELLKRIGSFLKLFCSKLAPPKNKAGATETCDLPDKKKSRYGTDICVYNKYTVEGINVPDSIDKPTYVGSASMSLTIVGILNRLIYEASENFDPGYIDKKTMKKLLFDLTDSVKYLP